MWESSKLDMNQYEAHLCRIALMKRRRPISTFCELFSHLVILFAIFLGFSMSRIVSNPRSLHSDVNVHFPPAFLRDDSSRNEKLASYYEIMSGPLIIPNLDQYHAIGQFIKGRMSNQRDFIRHTDVGIAFANLISGRKLYFAPANSYVHDFISYLNETYYSFNDNGKTSDNYNTEKVSGKTTFYHYEIFENEQVALDELLSRPYDVVDDFFALIIIHEKRGETLVNATNEIIEQIYLDVTIRQEAGATPNTNILVMDPGIGFSTDYQKYVLGGFMTLKQAVHHWVISRANAEKMSYQTDHGNSTCPPIKMELPQIAFTPFPTVAYQENPFFVNVGFLLGIAMIMSIIFPIAQLAKCLVEEKESGMFQLMASMGMKLSIHFLSWFSYVFLLSFWIALTSSILLASLIYLHTSFWVIFFLYFLFLLSINIFVMMITPFFFNASLISMVMPLAVIALSLPKFVFNGTNNNEFVLLKTVVSLLAPTAFVFAIDFMNEFEYTSSGVTFTTNSPDDQVLSYDSMTYTWCIVMLFIDFIGYLSIAIIVRSFSMESCKSFCFCRRSVDTVEISNSSRRPNDAGKNDMSCHESPTSDGITPLIGNFSPGSVPCMRTAESQAAVVARDLVKCYDNGVLAVNHLSVSFYEGKITCLLGHNGAGT